MSDAVLGIGRRVLVTGMAGSGKSTFSRSLAAKTGLPAIHLDLHFWKPGWVAPSEREWREKQSGLLASDAWIADGNYHETLDLRLERADTVVFLDTPWWVCAGRAFFRGLRKPVGEMPEGCDDSSWRRLRDEWRLAIVIWRNRRSEPEREHEIISQYGQHAVLHALGSKRAAREFLDGLFDCGQSPPARAACAFGYDGFSTRVRGIQQRWRRMSALSAGWRPRVVDSVRSAVSTSNRRSSRAQNGPVVRGRWQHVGNVASEPTAGVGLRVRANRSTFDRGHPG